MEEKKEKPLSQDRYDSKLFKQAVKAAKEAKELEKRKKKKERVLRGLLFVLIMGLVAVIVYFAPPLFTPKEQYTLSQEYSQRVMYEYIQEGKISYEQDESIFIPSLSAQSAIVFNPFNGDVLYEKNINERRSIASLTKLMTAIVVIENFQLDDVIDVKLENIPEDLDWQSGLKEGDKISVENLLKAMLISSYNDTGYIFANAYLNGGYEGFLNEMNRKATVLKMNSSHFGNPVGIDDTQNYSTAMDIAILTSVVRKYADILRIVEVEKEVINWSGQEGLISKEILSTNKLFEENKYIQGLKTGITDLAGQCFAGYFIYPNGNELVTVVINSKDRFGDTTLLEKYSRSILK